jgi:uncharacterized protein (TIGR03437 family)
LQRMILTVLAAVFPSLALAQGVTMSLSSGSAVKGGQVLLNLSVASVTNQQPASLQWKFNYTPADLAFVAAGNGSSAVAAGKTITCSGASGAYRCIASGINKNLIPNGVLATLLFSVATTTTNPQPVIGLTGAIAAAPAATTIAAAATGSTIVVQPSNLPSLTITTPSLPAGQVGLTYAQTLAAANGTVPYTWSLLSGALPPGMSLSAAGMISGMPTTAGSFALTVQVKDSNQLSKSQAFTVTIASAAAALPKVENAASFGPIVSPNTWISIIGTNLASTTRALGSADVVGGFLPTTLNGVGVTVNGEAAPISLVSPTQINALIPRDIIPGTGQIKIVGGTNTIPALNTLISPLSPGFFTWVQPYIAANHLDNTMAVKTGVFPSITTVPAKPGETIVLIGTGFGPTTPLSPLGQMTPPNGTYAVNTPLTVTIGGLAAQYVGGKLVGQPGMYRITVVVPPQLVNGDWPVIATVGGVTSQAGVLLTVQK